MASIQIGKGAGGRPPKFKEVRRPITVTLPERILKSLERVSPDRAKALVKCVEATLGAEINETGSVELIEVLPGKALIVVDSNRSLSRIDWLRLVEIAPARYLLVFPPGMPIERLEVELQDLVESLTPAEAEERLLLERLQKILTQHRRQKMISKGELLLVDVSR